MDNLINTSNETTLLGQHSAHAFMKAGEVWMSGCQAIGQTFAAATQAHFGHVFSGWKAMSGVKSFKEAADLQKTLMRDSVENIVVSTGKITEAAMSMVQESMAPLTAAMTTAAEKLAIRAN